MATLKKFPKGYLLAIILWLAGIGFLVWCYLKTPHIRMIGESPYGATGILLIIVAMIIAAGTGMNEPSRYH